MTFKWLTDGRCDVVERISKKFDMEVTHIPWTNITYFLFLKIYNLIKIAEKTTKRS